MESLINFTISLRKEVEINPPLTFTDPYDRLLVKRQQHLKIIFDDITIPIVIGAPFWAYNKIFIQCRR